MIRHALALLRTWFAVLVVAGTFAWSVAAILRYQVKQVPPGAIVLRIAHWQLEAGVRDGLETMAAEYQKLHPDKKIHIVQDAIPEGTYGQWLSTQLMGGTGPDIVELGHGCLPPAVWLAYCNRYFVPLTPFIQRPNPYNKGTALDGVPLRLTIEDGMQSTYKPEMQEYMSIPLSQFGVRVFYNKDLLMKLTGLDTCPADYREFLAVCEKIKRQKDEKGRPYTPIAGSKYHLPMWEAYLCDLVSFPILNRVDFNHDGSASMDEIYIALKSGYITVDDPGLVARFRMIRQITDQFQPGWMGLGRDEAVFLFAQQRAVFLSTGTWDAMSLRDQAEGQFEVRVMDFPLPSKDDPEYGQNVVGPLYERPNVGFMFGLNRSCKHPEVALDFLFFLASRKYNEQLNKIIGWIPGTKGCDMDPLLRAFRPHLDGVQPPISSGTFNLGGETWIKWLQYYSLFQIKNVDYRGMMDLFLPVYLNRGLTDYQEQVREARRGFQKNEQLTAGIRAEALDETDPEKATSHWIRYAALKCNNQIDPEMSYAAQWNILSGKTKVVTDYGPYEYSPRVLDHVRQRVKQKLETGQ